MPDSHHQCAQQDGTVLFQCSLPRRSVKILASAVQCAANVGKVLILEATQQAPGNSTQANSPQQDPIAPAMTLRTFNDTTTQYLMFTLREPFFEKFSFPNSSMPGATADMDLASVRGKLAIKSCLTVFRTVRAVERLEISFVRQGAMHVVVFTATCKFGIVKQHRFFYEDSELEQPVVSVRKHRVVCRTTMLHEVLGHVNGMDEITLRAKENAIVISTYSTHADERSARSTLKTEMTIDQSDLESYNFALKNDGMGSESVVELTFAQVGLKALLQFCNATAVDVVSMLFSESGDPVLVSSNNDDPSFTNANAFDNDNDIEMSGAGGGGGGGGNGSDPLYGSLFEVSLVMATIDTFEALSSTGSVSGMDTASLGAAHSSSTTRNNNNNNININNNSRHGHGREQQERSAMGAPRNVAPRSAVPRTIPRPTLPKSPPGSASSSSTSASSTSGAGYCGRPLGTTAAAGSTHSSPYAVVPAHLDNRTPDIINRADSVPGTNQQYRAPVTPSRDSDAGSANTHLQRSGHEYTPAMGANRQWQEGRGGSVSGGGGKYHTQAPPMSQESFMPPLPATIQAAAAKRRRQMEDKRRLGQQG